MDLSGLVVEEEVASVACEIQIVASVVVVIAHAHTQAEDFDFQSAAFGDIGKGAVAIVAIKRAESVAAWRLGGRIESVLLFVLASAALPVSSDFLWRPVAPIDQKQVRPPIPVVIEKRCATAHTFWKKFQAKGTSIMAKIYARAARDIGELNGLRGQIGG